MRMAELENKTQNEGASTTPNTTPQPAAPAASSTPATGSPANTVPPTAPAATPTSPVIQAPIIKKSASKGRKMSPVTLAIGCVIFFMLFV